MKLQVIKDIRAKSTNDELIILYATVVERVDKFQYFIFDAITEYDGTCEDVTAPINSARFAFH
jgi:hypothetical protein